MPYSMLSFHAFHAILAWKDIYQIAVLHFSKKAWKFPVQLCNV